MQTLTDDQCAAWLAARELVGDPYHRPDPRDDFYAQVPLPAAARAARAMLRNLVLLARPFETALLHITDWSLYSPDEMAVVTALRKTCGEERWLIKSPGHVFEGDERDLLIGMMGLVAAYGWTAYVYFDHGLTVLLWEGDLMDVWDRKRERHRDIVAMLSAE